MIRNEVQRKADHIGVNDLAATALPSLNQSKQNSHCAGKASSCEIGKKVYGKARFLFGARQDLPPSEYIAKGRVKYLLTEHHSKQDNLYRGLDFISSLIS
jgi:hypothetical protein